MILRIRYQCIILLLFLFSCTKENTKDQSVVIVAPKKIEWDYLNSSFKNSDNHNSLVMLCGYDTFGLKKIDDSLFEMKLSEFQGWKRDSKKYNDTIKLIDSKKFFDSLGNQKAQILKFSNKNNVDLELKIRHSSISHDSIYTYEYSGKIKINNKKLKYSCDKLWVK